MADRRFLEDPDFLALPPADQRDVMGQLDPDFAGLGGDDQETVLAQLIGRDREVTPFQQAVVDIAAFPGRIMGEDPERPDYASEAGEAMAGAWRSGLAGLDKVAGNLSMLLDKTAQYGEEGVVTEHLREREAEQRAAAEEHYANVERRDAPMQMLEVAAGLPAALLPAAAAAALGGPIAGFAGLGALEQADQGAAAALRGGVKGGLVGGAFKVPGVLKAPAVAGASYALSEDPDPVARVIDAAAMGLLALGGAGGREARLETPREVRRELESIAREEPVAVERAPERVPRQVDPVFGEQPAPYKPIGQRLLERLPGVKRPAEEPVAEREITPEEAARIGMGEQIALPQANPVRQYETLVRRAPAAPELTPGLERPRAPGVVESPRGLEDVRPLDRGPEPAGPERALPEGLDLARGVRGGGERAAPVDVEAARGAEPGALDRGTRERVAALEADRSGARPGSPAAGLDAAGPPGHNYIGFRDVDQVPPNTPLPKSIVKRGDVMEDLARALEIPVQQGSIKPMRRPGVLGYAASNLAGGYSRARRARATQTVRVRNWGDIQVAAHEISHVLDAKHPAFAQWYDIRLNKGKPATPAQKLVGSVSYDATLPWEGFAEFNRLWFTQKAKLEALGPEAPGVVKEFEALAQRTLSPKQWKAMKRGQEEMHRYFAQGGEAALESVIGPNNKAGSVLSNTGDRFRQAMVDDLHGVLMAERLTLGREQAGLPEGTYAKFRLLRAIPQAVEQMWTRGAPEWKDGKVGEAIEFTGKGLRDILAPVARNKAAMRQFEKYAIARMGREMHAQGREKMLTPGMIEAGLKLETPARKKAFDELVEFNGEVADFAQQSGLFNAEQRARWRRDEYAWSLVREMGEMSRGGKIEDPLAASSGIHALRGSSRNLRDPIDAIMAGPGKLMQLSLENLAKRSLLELIGKPGGGRLGQRMPPDSKMARISRETLEEAVNRGIKENGLELEKGWMQDAGYPEFLNLFAGQKPPHGDRIMSMLVNGKPVYVELFDPVLAKSVEAMRRPAQGMVENILFSAPRRFYQRAITSFPNFWAAQIIRDPIMATIQTRTGLQAMTSSARGYAESLRNGPLRQELEANLGGIGGERPRNPAQRRADLMRYARRGTLDPRRVLDLANPANMFRYLEKIGVATEEGPRIGEFARARAQGREGLPAGYMAREVTTDFSVQGGHPAARFLANAIPFYRAMVASADRAYRANVRDPNWRGATRARFAAFAGLAAAYHLWVRDQDWYKNLADWDKLSYFVFPPVEIPGMGTVHPTLASLYEVGLVGQLTGRYVEHLIDMVNGEDPSEAKLAGDTLAAISHNFGVGLPVYASALLEQYANRTAFTGVPIESREAEGMDPWQRTNPQTPLILSDLLRLQKGVVDPEYQLSPARGTAALRAFGGPWAQFGLMAADVIAHPGIADLHWDDLPILSRFAQRAGKYTNTQEKFHDFLEAADDARGSFNQAKELGDFETVEEYRELPRRRIAKRAARWANAVAAMTNEIEETKRDPGLTGAQKTEIIDRIKREREAYMRGKLDQAEEIRLEREREE